MCFQRNRDTNVEEFITVKFTKLKNSYLDFEEDRGGCTQARFFEPRKRSLMRLKISIEIKREKKTSVKNRNLN